MRTLRPPSVGWPWLAALCLWAAPALAQTAGGTAIENRATATYSDGGGNTYNTTSNTVTVGESLPLATTWMPSGAVLMPCGLFGTGT